MVASIQEIMNCQTSAGLKGLLLWSKNKGSSNTANIPQVFTTCRAFYWEFHIDSNPHKIPEIAINPRAPQGFTNCSAKETWNIQAEGIGDLYALKHQLLFILSRICI